MDKLTNPAAYAERLEKTIKAQVSQIFELHKENERLKEQIAGMYNVLDELVTLMDAAAEHQYQPDSFTTQPAKLVLGNIDAALDEVER